MSDGPPEFDFGQDDEPPDRELLARAEAGADTDEKREALENAKRREGGE